MSFLLLGRLQFLSLGQKEHPNGFSTGFNLFFLLPIGFFSYPFLTHSLFFGGSLCLGLGCLGDFVFVIWKQDLCPKEL